jgi:hypothetical protein
MAFDDQRLRGYGWLNATFIQRTESTSTGERTISMECGRSP